jgi:putative ABC transport system permease protein
MTTGLLIPVTLLCGLVPALRLSRTRIRSVMARGSRQVGSSLSRRGSQALIAAEVALAVVLVAGAGLMLRSFMRISAVDLGFEPDGLVTMEVLPLDRDPGAHREYYWALQQRLRRTAGLTSVGIVDNFALGGGGTYTGILVPGGKSTGTSIFELTPGYLETIGARLREGRFPTEADYTSGYREHFRQRVSEVPAPHAASPSPLNPGTSSSPWMTVPEAAKRARCGRSTHLCRNSDRSPSFLEGWRRPDCPASRRVG